MTDKSTDDLVGKLADARDDLYDYDRKVETQMINAPEYVNYEMVAEIKKLRKALESIQTDCENAKERYIEESDIDGILATVKEALGIGEESNAL